VANKPIYIIYTFKLRTNVANLYDFAFAKCYSFYFQVCTALSITDEQLITCISKLF